MQTGRLFALLLVFCLLLAGCLQVPDQDASGDPSTEDAGRGGSEDGDGSSPGEDDDGPQGSNGTQSEDGAPEDEGPEQAPCHEKEKTHGRYPPAPPQEQEVRSVEEILCPGHFVVTGEGSGDVWQAPTWETGDWWHYQRDQLNETGYECHQRFHETVNTTGVFWDVPVYRLDVAWSDCHGNAERAHDQNRTQSSLSEFSDERWGKGKGHGYINHFVLFPLQDGKKWRFMNAAGRIVDSEVDHEPNHLSGGEIVEAWRVDSMIESVQITQWYGVDERNLLREERRINDLMFDYTVLVDSGQQE